MADRAGRSHGGLQPAPNGYPIKLVRDRTAEIVNPSGEPGDLWYGELQDESGAEYLRLLRLKLAEEVGEYLVDGGIEELADVQAVVDALVVAQGEAQHDFRVRVKSDPRGGFFARVVWRLRYMRGWVRARNRWGWFHDCRWDAEGNLKAGYAAKLDKESQMSDSTAALLGTTDPQRWAQEFRETVLDGVDVVEQDVLIGWFANAMQAKESSILGVGTHKMSTEELHELVFLVGGAATGPCLKNGPDLVMPTEEVIEGINAVLAARGLPTRES